MAAGSQGDLAGPTYAPNGIDAFSLRNLNEGWVAMSTPAKFMEDVLSMWTNPDSEARAAVLRARFAEDIRFHDADGEFVGYTGLEKFSASLRKRFPNAGFSLTTAPDTVGNSIRAFWRFGPPADRAIVTGMDFVIWDGERASALYAFVNLPARG